MKQLFFQNVTLTSERCNPYIFGILAVAATFNHWLSAIDEKPIAVELEWHTDEESAKAEAAETGSPIFFYFTADWCSFCHQMEKETLSHPAASAFLMENFVLCKVDFDSNKDLAARYRIQGVPACVLGDPNLEKTEVTSGYMPLDVFIAWLDFADEAVSPQAIELARKAAERYLAEMRSRFREGKPKEQSKAIQEFFEKCAAKDPRALEFAKSHLSEEVQQNPAQFSEFLTDKKLHIRIATTNAFAGAFGNEFTFDPWDLSDENSANLNAFLNNRGIKR